MVFDRYVTNNPFRVLGMPSATPVATLVGLIPGIVQGRVAINTALSLPALFDAVSSNECIEEIRQAETSAVIRTVFRIFWPLEYDASVCKRWTREDEESAILALRLGPVDASGAVTVARRQQAFLQDWTACSRTLKKMAYSGASVSSSDEGRLISQAGIVLNELKRLRSLPEFRAMLAQPLLAEGESSPSDVVEAALYEARDQIVSVLLGIYASEWQQRRCFAILETISTQEGFANLSLDLFRDVLALGDEEARRLDSFTAAYQGWQSPKETIAASRPLTGGRSLTPLMLWRTQRQEVIDHDFEQSRHLNRLMREMSDFAPEAWGRSLRNFETTVAMSMLVVADRYAESEDTYADAIEILEAIKSHPGNLNADVHEEVSRKIAHLKPLVKQPEPVISPLVPLVQSASPQAIDAAKSDPKSHVKTAAWLVCLLAFFVVLYWLFR